MDKSSDYWIALQLQSELIDLTNIENVCQIDLTQSSSYETIDLTEYNDNHNINEQKRKSNSSSSQIIKKTCLNATQSIVDSSWETIDPNPDVHGLFLAFNRQYFWNSLDSVSVKWNNRMTVCAGLCRYQYGQCSISLSEPLLKLRPRKDVVETLLHEMIHAYLFLTKNSDHKDRDGHGSEFCKHMYRINKSAGTSISIYHNFHEEVKLYRQHWWKCNGPCQNHPPFYGYVKRSINRTPSINDVWWTNHQATCGGSFIKIKEPEGYGEKKKKKVTITESKSVNKITNFIKILKPPAENLVVKNENNHHNEEEKDDTTLCPVCNETVFSDWLNIHLQNCSSLKELFDSEIEDSCRCAVCNEEVERSLMEEHLNVCKNLNNVFNNKLIDVSDEKDSVNCPKCNKVVQEKYINEHLDICIDKESPKNIDEKKIICPCCEQNFTNVIELDDHIDGCLMEN
ncbi:DNA-dependent metalloprotease dvc-1 [Daktulosphaira vitifoliae]|uniref:DNA-dependent metalloprotease dvc-1 n=1 Tax=Daktulosphaira vitifoliae TaxID=58002 RepID=UPI0021AA38B1|nr:DNA-dependent metalloprotease dvc-1 [Daktulosphaira vitifoliae]